jgi:molybdenum cofactor cytidylyltransferase
MRPSPPDPAIRADTQALVLAAGAGLRFGGGKLVAIHRGRPLIDWAVAAALATPVAGVHVVLGAQAAAVRAALSDRGDPRLAFVPCPDWADGLAASLRRGVAALPPETRALLIFLGDMPDVDPGLARRLLDRVLAGAPAAMPVHRGRPAHPVAVAGAHLSGLMHLSGDRGARAYLDRIGAVEVATDDPGSVFDIDTPDELDRSPGAMPTQRRQPGAGP